MKFDLIVILKGENEQGGITTTRMRYRAFNVKSVVAGVQGLIDTGVRHDSEIFHGGIKVAALQRNNFYRAAKGDNEALTRLEATQFDEAKVVRGQSDVLDLTEAEFFARFPIKFTPLSDERAKSALGAMTLQAALYNGEADDEEEPLFEQHRPNAPYGRVAPKLTLEQLEEWV